jgi:hypothetical protein
MTRRWTEPLHPRETTMAAIGTTRHDDSISRNRRGTVIRRLVVLVALTVVLSSCSTAQVQLWWQVYLGQGLTYSQAEQTAEEINQNVTPGCGQSYAGCLPNNVTDIDCEYFRGIVGSEVERLADGPVWIDKQLQIRGWDHYQLDTSAAWGFRAVGITCPPVGYGGR